MFNTILLMKYTLIQSLIGLAEKFEKETDSSDLIKFLTWSYRYLDEGSGQDAAHDSLLLPFKVIYLYKKLKKLTREVLSSSALSSLDDYSFLLHLEDAGSLRKMEIISMHEIEAPTGIEIIRRLIRNDLVEEFPDPDDRRAKRIKLTAEGKKELEIVRPKIDHVFEGFVRDLPSEERAHLSGLLDKLIRS